MSLATAWGVWLVDLFESDSTLVIHNAAFDLGFLAQLCYEPGGGVMGIPGLNASKVIISDHKSAERKRRFKERLVSRVGHHVR